MRARLILPLLLFACPAAAGTILVDHGGSGDYLTIEGGISAAVYGDTVLVACGTYHEHDIVMRSGVCLRSETGQPECVTVDADSLGRGFYCSNLDSMTLFEGLTVANGFNPDKGGAMFCEYSSPTVANCAFTDNGARHEGGDAYGGGIAFEWSTPTITGCGFSGNAVSSGWPHGDSYGGALSFKYSDSAISGCVFSGNGGCASAGGAIYGQSSSLTLAGCTFEENHAVYGGGVSAPGASLFDCVFLSNGCDYSHGGAADVGRDGTVTGCTFEENVAEFGGALWCGSGTSVADCVFLNNSADYTGAVDCMGRSTFEGCTFSGNRSGWSAGALQMFDGGTVQQCVFTGNLAERSGGGICCGTPHEGELTSIIDCVIADNESYETGGGISCDDTTRISIIGCTISGNTAWGGGGAISVAGGANPVVERTILAFSHAGGAALCDSTSTLSLLECDVFGNEEGDWVDCIAGQESAGGNFSLDPLFCDMGSDDFSLCANSPCLPAGGGQRDLVGALGQGCDNCDSPVEGVFFVGACSERVVTLRWSVENLAGIAGLSVYRATEPDGPFVRLNDALLPALSPGAYVDTTVWPGTTFHYDLKAVRHDGGEEDVGDHVNATTPGTLAAALHAPRPNPFRDRCSVLLDLPLPSKHAVVAIFDITGRRVLTLHDAPLPRGRREFSWDGSDDTGNQCASGIYFLQCDAGHAVLQQRVTLMR